MERLKRIRLENGYSQKDLADLLFVNQTAVSQWERAATTPSYELLFRICDIFNVTTDYLLGRTDSPNPVQGEVMSDPVNAFPFSPDEQELLHEYQSLTADGKEYIKQIMLMTLKTYKKCHSDLDTEPLE